MRTTVLVVLLVVVAAAQDLWHDGSTRPSAGDYAAEAGSALIWGVLVGTGAAAVLGYAAAAAASPYDDPALGAFLAGASGAVLGYPLGCGLGTALVGRAAHTEGNTGGAYIGAYLFGLPIGIGLALIGGISQYSNSWVSGLAPVFFVAGGLAPPVGAVIGFNAGGGSLAARLAPSALAYRTRLGPERQRYSTFDCRLVTVRF